MAQCIGISARTGEPCRLPAVHGADHCVAHGGIAESKTPTAIQVRVDHPRVRCSATRTNSGGEPCKNYAVPGATVCRFHGGATKQVMRKAKERLMEAVDPAITQLQRIINKPDTSDADRLRAIQLILDRTGYHAKTELTAEVEVKPWQEIASDIILVNRGRPVVQGELVDPVAERQDALDAAAFAARPNAEVIKHPSATGSVPAYLRRHSAGH